MTGFLRFAPALSVVLLVMSVVMSVPSIAAASEAQPEDESAAPIPHTLRIGATFAAAELKQSSAYRPYASGGLLQIAGSYRVSRLLALGGLASTTVADDGEQSFWHVAGEARLLVLSSRFVEIWGAAELGLAATTYAPTGCGGCGPVSDADLRTHFGPIFGPGAGVDFLPIKQLSLGVEARALVPIYAAAPVAGGPTGLAPVFMLGLTFAVHLATD